MLRPILVLLALTILFSCRKQGFILKPRVTNPTSYLLVKQTWTGPPTNGESFTYYYNSDHLVSRIARYQWGTMSINNGPAQTWQDTTEIYTFEYTNGVCTKWALNTGGYFTYEYNNKSLPVKRSVFSGGISTEYYSYKYDDSDNVIEMDHYEDNRLVHKTNLGYNNKNNLTSIVVYDTWSSPQRKRKYEYHDFDNKINFIKAVNGLPASFVTDNNFHSFSSSSPNNFISEDYYDAINSDESFTSGTLWSYGYTYNDEGLPTRMTYGPWVVTFEYVKYK